MRRIVAIGFIAVLAVTIRFATVDGQEKKDAKQPPRLESLEALQAEGLKNSHDIKVYEAKVRLAEAELAAMRAKVLAKISAAHAEVEGAVVSEKEGRIRLKRAEVSYANKVIT